MWVEETELKRTIGRLTNSGAGMSRSEGWEEMQKTVSECVKMICLEVNAVGVR